MPPKIPNLRFKPKLVARSRPPTPEDADREGLTRLQLERLQQAQPSSLLGPTSSSSPRDNASSGLSKASLSNNNNNNNHHNHNDNNNKTGLPTTAAGNPKEDRPFHQGRTVILQEVLPRSTGEGVHPDRAEPFDENTVYAILNPTSDDVEGVICPIPLEHHDHHRREGMDFPPMKASSELLGGIKQEKKDENEEEEQQQPPVPRLSSSSSSPAVALDGTAFLREGDEELSRARQANWRFYQQTLSAEASLDVKMEYEEQYEIGSFPSGKNNNNGEEIPLVYMQMPRFFTNPPFTFANLPPGKVGEFKVFKSGRMVMEIAGVYYDVLVEGAEEGAYSTVVITEPSSDPLDPDAKPSCYEVGGLKMKMVCTPAVEED